MNFDLSLYSRIHSSTLQHLKVYIQTMREIRPLSGRPAGFDFVRPCHPERSGAQAREVELRSSA
ncbi:MAG: hypothetical protein J6L87_01125, partial [Clostridia bacterium]|nr:hypothetical protein [Clostridia bacterium]